MLVASGRFQAVLDADVLYSSLLRDLLMRLAVADLYRARWSAQILDETFRNILANRPDLDVARLARTRQLMAIALPDAAITGHEALISSIDLPDPGDRHVVAAAVRCGAEVIVTRNIRHYPSRQIDPLGIEAQHPDDFVVGLVHIGPGAVLAALADQAADLNNPPISLAGLLDALERHGLAQASNELRRLT